MKAFLDNSKGILRNIDELKTIVANMDEYIRLKQTSVLPEDKETALDGKMDGLDGKFDTICVSIKDAIETAQNETRQLEKDEEISKEEVELRNVHIYKYFKELTKAVYSYRNLKSEFKNKEGELLRQAYQVMHPQATEEELNELGEGEDCDEKLGAVFATGTAGGQEMLKKAKYRRKRIEKIVTAVNRLIVLIQEIDELVKKNTRVVDEIVVHVTKAEMHTRQANRELEEALEYQRRLNFIKRMVLLVVVILVVVMLTMLTATSFMSGEVEVEAKRIEAELKREEAAGRR